MIDYLEQLLDQMPEEEEEHFSWPQTGTRYAAAGKSGKKKRLADDEASVPERNGQREEKRDQVQGVDWETALAGITARASRQEKEWEKNFAGREFASADLTGQDRKEEQKPGNRAAARPEQVRKADLERKLSELGHAVARGKANREALAWKQKVASGAEAEGGTTGRRRDELRGEPRRGLVSWLDAAFERDARRYDGPLGLF